MAVKFQSKTDWNKMPFRNFVFFSVIIDVFLVIAVLAVRNYLPPIVPLLYGRPTGAGQLIPSLFLISAPISSIIITFLNIFLSNLTGDIFIKKILALSSFLLSVLVAITIIQIVLLVGFF